MSEAQPAIRHLVPPDWPAATTLMARAFVDEPFIQGLYGDDRLERFRACLDRYRLEPWPEAHVVLGAFVDDVIVGTVVVAPPGHCFSCTIGDPPDDPVELLDWRFYDNARAAHRGEGEHAWLGRLATEPVLRGSGLGSALLRAAAEASDDLAPTLLLECEGHRRALYERAGFRQTALIPDDIGPPALLMRRDRGATGPAGPRSRA